MDERTEQGRRFLMGYRDDDTTEFVSDQEKKLPQPPLCKAPMGGERTVLPRICHAAHRPERRCTPCL